MPLSVPSGAPTLFIRRSAYEKSGIDRAAIDERLGLTPEEFRVEGALIAIGPIPGEDTLTDVISELESNGLTYFEDFFELSGNWPEWLRLFCAAADGGPPRPL
jgi:hypothetical protein